MYSLIIDTTTKYLTVVITQDNCVLASFNRCVDRQQAKMLIPVIEKLLEKQKINLSKIDVLGINRGPGSFTGLRIGIAAIKGLSFALNKPIVAFSGLEALANNVEVENQDLVCPVVDAKRQQVYSAIYEFRANNHKRKTKYFLGNIEALVELITKQKVINKNKITLWFSGDGVALYKDRIMQSDLNQINCRIRFAPGEKWYPQPKVLAEICFKLFQQDKKQDSKQIQAMYLYKNTCTIRKKC